MEVPQCSVARIQIGLSRLLQIKKELYYFALQTVYIQWWSQCCVYRHIAILLLSYVSVCLPACLSVCPSVCIYFPPQDGTDDTRSTKDCANYEPKFIINYGDISVFTFLEWQTIDSKKHSRVTHTFISTLRIQLTTYLIPDVLCSYTSGETSQMAKTQPCRTVGWYIATWCLPLPCCTKSERSYGRGICLNFVAFISQHHQPGLRSLYHASWLSQWYRPSFSQESWDPKLGALIRALTAKLVLSIILC